MKNVILLLLTIVAIIFSGCVDTQTTTMSIYNDDSDNVFAIKQNNTDVYKTKVFVSRDNIVYEGIITKYSVTRGKYTLEFEDNLIVNNPSISTCNVRLGSINRITILKRGFVGGAWDGYISSCEWS